MSGKPEWMLRLQQKKNKVAPPVETPEEDGGDKTTYAQDPPEAREGKAIDSKPEEGKPAWMQVRLKRQQPEKSTITSETSAAPEPEEEKDEAKDERPAWMKNLKKNISTRQVEQISEKSAEIEETKEEEVKDKRPAWMKKLKENASKRQVEENAENSEKEKDVPEKSDEGENKPEWMKKLQKKDKENSTEAAKVETKIGQTEPAKDNDDDKTDKAAPEGAEHESKDFNNEENEDSNNGVKPEGNVEVEAENGPKEESKVVEQDGSDAVETESEKEGGAGLEDESTGDREEQRKEHDVVENEGSDEVNIESEQEEGQVLEQEKIGEGIEQEENKNVEQVGIEEGGAEKEQEETEDVGQEGSTEIKVGSEQEESDIIQEERNDEMAVEPEHETEEEKIEENKNEEQEGSREMEMEMSPKVEDEEGEQRGKQGAEEDAQEGAQEVTDTMETLFPDGGVLDMITSFKEKTFEKLDEKANELKERETKESEQLKKDNSVFSDTSVPSDDVVVKGMAIKAADEKKSVTLELAAANRRKIDRSTQTNFQQTNTKTKHGPAVTQKRQLAASGEQKKNARIAQPQRKTTKRITAKVVQPKRAGRQTRAESSASKPVSDAKQKKTNVPGSADQSAPKETKKETSAQTRLPNAGRGDKDAGRERTVYNRKHINRSGQRDMHIEQGENPADKYIKHSRKPNTSSSGDYQSKKDKKTLDYRTDENTDWSNGTDEKKDYRKQARERTKHTTISSVPGHVGKQRQFDFSIQHKTSSSVPGPADKERQIGRVTPTDKVRKHRNSEEDLGDFISVLRREPADGFRDRTLKNKKDQRRKKINRNTKLKYRKDTHKREVSYQRERETIPVNKKRSYGATRQSKKYSYNPFFFFSEVIDMHLEGKKEEARRKHMKKKKLKAETKSKKNTGIENQNKAKNHREIDQKNKYEDETKIRNKDHDTKERNNHYRGSGHGRKSEWRSKDKRNRRSHEDSRRRKYY